MKPAFTLRGDDTVLPKGTRVVTNTAVVDDSGAKHRAGILAVVRDVDGPDYTLETPAGTILRVQRHELQLERADVLAELGRRQWDERRLRDNIIYAAVVGSQAWGLADAGSDEDVRGCFVLPFEEHAGVYDAPDEIHDENKQLACWEIEKLIRQALRADPNTLETLWSPLVKIQTPLGKNLVEARGIFSSRRVVQSFGRYATTQLDKLARAAERAHLIGALVEEIAAARLHDEPAAVRFLKDKGASHGDDIHALVRSLFDRGLLKAASFAALREAVAELGPARLVVEEVRPKNAYNLVRLLASCLHWLEHGTPLISVDGALRNELLAIKRSETPLPQTLARAHVLAKQVEERAAAATILPDVPDVDAADALLREARREQARVAFGIRAAPQGPAVDTGGNASATHEAFTRRWFPTPLPADVDVGSLKRFLEQKLADKRVVIVSLTGAHAYGFPSPDSDLDLKGIDAAPAARLLGLKAPPDPLEVIEIFEGREMDLSSHELGMAAGLLLKGNGNMLERLLGPLVIVTSPIGERLARIAQRSLSKRAVHHYRGFLQAMKRESDIEAREKRRTAKRLLYAYRVACSGAHILLENQLVTDVRALGPVYGFAAHVEELYARKRSGEFSTLSEAEAAPYLAEWPKLDALLDDALTRSPLPNGPGDDVVADLDALLVEARLA